MGIQLTLPIKEVEPPIFGPFLLWPNGWMHQDATWFGGRPHRLSPGNFVVDGDPAVPPQKGRNPQFSAHVYCGQTAAYMDQDVTSYGGRC